MSSEAFVGPAFSWALGSLKDDSFFFRSWLLARISWKEMRVSVANAALKEKRADTQTCLYCVSTGISLVLLIITCNRMEDM